MSIWAWVDLFLACHRIVELKAEFVFWPDGKCYYEQEQTTIHVFSIIKHEIELAIKPKPSKLK